MLAYVFWHWPRPETGHDAYEQQLALFHRALRDEPSRGFVRSVAYRVPRLPFRNPTPEAHMPLYEDWYLVEDWPALGALDEGAVSAPRSEPHARVSALSETGVGAIYALLRGAGALEQGVHAAWVSKPRELSYKRFRSSLRDLSSAAEVWQRQLVLGPAPEFCVTSATEVGLPLEPDAAIGRALVTRPG